MTNIQRVHTSDENNLSIDEIRRFGPFESSFNASKKRPPMTYCYNNGRLAFVDGSGNLYITLQTSRNIHILQQNKYSPADWGVPLSNGSNPEFDHWFLNEKAMEEDRRVRALPMPDVPAFGSFVIGNALPGTFVLSKDQSMIFWCSGKSGSETVVTPNTPANLQTLKAIGYTEGAWQPTDLSKLTSSARNTLQEWLRINSLTTPDRTTD